MANYGMRALRATAHEYHDGLKGWDGMAIELEYADFLYALTRALRPDAVVETGAGRGIASTFLATALRDNGHGHLWSFEDDPRYADVAAKALHDLPATVVPRAWSSMQDAELHPALVYIDSGQSTRRSEMEWWLTHGGDTTVVIHDANRPYAELMLGQGVLLPRGDGLWIGNAGE